jgi:quercetin dioxygenase-like cupin family protein
MNTGLSFENGFVITKDEITNAENIAYRAHPSFKGVYLKDLATAKTTDGSISCHLVKVEPYCVLDHHIHENNLEIHEVIAGSAKALVGDQEVDYLPGTIGVLPARVPHKITAGEEGIYILAKFTPALV